ncbi:MFS transporter [Novosphingobium sp.]|uniref:MFS transporter n=1 Tax=Novosphingobium sp. TaxID=1874826 RepID=UPI00286E9427|nr:MFS transporter [Novosphingobium sp.]
MTEPLPTARQSQRFLLLYALAWAGGSVAYVPFLTILLPVRVSLLAGDAAGVSWLAYIAFAGAIAASAAFIGFGYLSDITRRRKEWVWLGLVLSCGLLALFREAETLPALIAIIIAWQLALNMMLAPLAAWAGDCVADAQMGSLGGLLAFAPGLGALAGAFVTLPGLASADTRLVLVGALVICCVVPVLLVTPPTKVSEPAVANEAARASSLGSPALAAEGRGAMRRMWFARLAVQIAEAALFSYLYFWFRSIDPEMGDNRTARVFSVVLILSAPIALWAGRWADRTSRPFTPLVACAFVSAAGLIGMALAPTLPVAIATYAVFGFATSIFLALHSGQTLRVLPRSDRRGRDLGLFNLTNTVPSLIMPWFTLALVPQFGFAALFLLFSALSLGAGLLLRPYARQF